VVKEKRETTMNSKNDVFTGMDLKVKKKCRDLICRSGRKTHSK
jgi:hypothetical protein